MDSLTSYELDLRYALAALLDEGYSRRRIDLLVAEILLFLEGSTSEARGS